MSTIQLTLKEIDMIATFVTRDHERPYSDAFQAATQDFYSADDFDPSDERLMAKVTIVQLPATAVASLSDRCLDVADEMDRRAKLAAKATDWASAERMHIGAGQLRASAVHIRRSA